MICKNCGSYNEKDAVRCSQCDTNLSETDNKSLDKNAANLQDSPVYSFEYTPIKRGYEPISAWEYVGWTILFSIPCIGWIMVFVYAFGSDKNINLKNFAMSHVILMAIAVGLYVIRYIFGLLYIF